VSGDAEVRLMNTGEIEPLPPRVPPQRLMEASQETAKGRARPFFYTKGEEWGYNPVYTP
jgi:hypothetical protein